MTGVIRSAAVVACGLFVLAACSSSSKPNATPTTVGPASTTTVESSGGSGARITAFDVPASVACASASKTTVHVDYTVTGAARVELAIDGLDLPSTPAAQGSLDAPVHCDAVPHTVALVAYDAHGARTSQVKMVTTVLGG